MDRLKASVPENKRLTVYYAEGGDGLSTECDDSFHSRLIPEAGGVNVRKCRSKVLVGMDKVSIEDWRSVIPMSS